MMEINKVISGFFYVSSTCFKFVSSSLKVTRIKSDLITHVFWSLSTITDSLLSQINSITIFTSNMHSYLFNFPNVTDIKEILNNLKKANLPNLLFFQKNDGSKEIAKLNLTQKWINREMTTFDYLIWLNLLSGRSSLNKHAYPIFPRMNNFDSENMEIVDFKKSPKLPNNHQIFGECLFEIEPFSSVYSDLEKMKDFTKIDYDYPPEFFMNEEFFSENVILPKWAPTKTLIVNILRKTLESDEVCNQLNHWIDTYFGTKQQQIIDTSILSQYHDISPLQLFHKPHPVRQLKVNSSKNDENTGNSNTSAYKITNLSKNVIDFCVSGNSTNDFKIFGLLSDGTIAQIHLNSPQTQIEVINKNISHVAFSDKKFFYSFGSTLGLFEIATKDIVLSKSDPAVSKISSVAISDNFGATGCTDGSVVLWATNLRNPENSSITNNCIKFSSVLLVHRSHVSSIMISSVFGMLASCDSKGLVAISLLPNLDLCHSFKLDNFTPRKIVITEGKGFVVIAGDNHGLPMLASSTINGLLVQRKELENRIVDMCDFVSTSGIDYVAICDSSNNVTLYDAFSLNVVKVVHSFNYPIQQIKYAPCIKSFIITTTSSEAPVIIIPFEMD